jgi:hypothetical protein
MSPVALRSPFQGLAGNRHGSAERSTTNYRFVAMPIAAPTAFERHVYRLVRASRTLRRRYATASKTAQASIKGRQLRRRALDLDWPVEQRRLVFAAVAAPLECRLHFSGGPDYPKSGDLSNRVRSSIFSVVGSGRCDCPVGKECLLITSEQIEFSRTALVTFQRRSVPLTEVTAVREYRSDITVNDEHLWGIEIVTLGKPIQFGCQLPRGESRWLISQLEMIRSRLVGESSSGQHAAGADPAPSLLTATAPPDPVVAADGRSATELTIENTLAQPPSDCDWQRIDDFQSTIFQRRHRLNPLAIFALLFVNLFWNGAISVFVLFLFGLGPTDMDGDGGQQNAPPEGLEWWGLALFLTPFVAIGCGMFISLLAALASGLRHTLLRLEPQRIELESRWPLLRRRKSWTVMRFDRLELRSPITDTAAPSGSIFASLDADERRFALAIVSEKNEDLCVLDRLTAGEARWIAHVLLAERLRWFA